MAKFHRDEVEVTDAFEAAFLNYLGYTVMRVTYTSPFETKWMFLIPACDAEILKEEFSNPETTMQLGAYIGAFKFCNHLRSKAKSSGGESASSEWQQMIKNGIRQ